MRRLAAAIVLAVLPLAACSPGGGSGGGSSSGGGAGSGGSTASEVPAPPVSLQRFGGIAGNRDEITVQPDGSWRRTARVGGTTTGTLSADRRDELSRMAAEPMLRAEATRTVPESDCADAFDYSAIVQRGVVRRADRDPAVHRHRGRQPADVVRHRRHRAERRLS
jgi:hypothetical protein